jgi:septum formation inhibitor-activating ATPase MinD
MSVLRDARETRRSGVHTYLFIYTVLTIIRRNGTEERAMITDKRGYSKTHTSASHEKKKSNLFQTVIYLSHTY